MINAAKYMQEWCHDLDIKSQSRMHFIIFMERAFETGKTFEGFKESTTSAKIIRWRAVEVISINLTGRTITPSSIILPTGNPWTTRLISKTRHRKLNRLQTQMQHGKSHRKPEWLQTSQTLIKQQVNIQDLPSSQPIHERIHQPPYCDPSLSRGYGHNATCIELQSLYCAHIHLRWIPLYK